MRSLLANHLYLDVKQIHKQQEMLPIIFIQFKTNKNFPSGHLQIGVFLFSPL
jgi:hypothetical protein